MPGRPKKIVNTTNDGVKYDQKPHEDKLNVDKWLYAIFIIISTVKVLLIHT